jgi:N-acetylglutamate synthase and related acetyltransferases
MNSDSGNDVLIRPATAEDATNIEIILSTYFLDRDDIPHERFFVAEKNGKVVGCAVFEKLKTQETEDIFFEIHTIAVLPPYKGKGIGRMLLNRLFEEIETEIKNSSEEEKILTAVYTRTTSPNFFIREGFEKADIDKKKYWDECVKCSRIELCSQTVLFKHLNL